MIYHYLSNCRSFSIIWLLCDLLEYDWYQQTGFFMIFLSWKEKSIFSSLLYHFFMIIVRSMLQYKPRFPLFMQNIVVLKTKSYVILITLIRRRVFATLAMTTTLIRENTKFEFFLSIGIKSMSISLSVRNPDLFGEKAYFKWTEHSEELYPQSTICPLCFLFLWKKTWHQKAGSFVKKVPGHVI